MNDCYDYYSAVGGKILNIAAAFFGGGRLPDPDRPGSGRHISIYISSLKGVYEKREINWCVGRTEGLEP
jgi:hypothetical protein